MTPLEQDGGSVLERLARRGPRAQAGERCEMCASPIADGHGHVVDIQARGMLCVCRPCYLLFTPDGAGHDHFRAVPDRIIGLGRDTIAPQLWDRLEVPVSVAFFFRNSHLDRVVGLYPGPGGATESELGLDAWDDITAAVPSLGGMEPDVEALLVRGGWDSGTDAYIVPIDRCYDLTGRLRAVWQGIDGGAAARETLDTVFAELAERARPAEGVDVR